MNKNFWPLIMGVLLVLALILAGAYVYLSAQPGADRAEEQNAADGSKLIGGDKDEYGCLIAAGYSWCEAKQKCLRTWEEVCGTEPAETDIEGIRQAFMAKYGKSAEEIRVTVQMFDGEYARGGVNFAMDGEFGPGGIFLVYREGGSWKIAFDGNGMYDCAQIDGLGFPADMAIGCDSEPGPAPTGTQLANPASVNCVEKGGQVEIKMRAEGGQAGYCVFADGSECDEWALFRGECAPGN